MPFPLYALITFPFYHIAFAQANDAPAISGFLGKVASAMAAAAKDHSKEKMVLIKR